MKIYFLITRLNLKKRTILASSNHVKPRFSKLTFKKSWLENYSVKSRLKITKNKILVLLGLNMVYFFVRQVLVLYEYFWSLSLEHHEVLYLCVSEEKTNQLLKGERKRLLIDLLINAIFSKLILSLNFKTELFPNKGLV